MEDVFVSGLTTEKTLEDVDSVTTAAISNIDEKIDKSFAPMNRAQRRALQKKMGKQGKQQLDVIGETAKKLNYIDLIQKLRQLNAEKRSK